MPVSYTHLDVYKRQGVYFGKSYDKTGKELFTATMNPNRGAWLEFETDSNDIFYVRIDKMCIRDSFMPLRGAFLYAENSLPGGV